MRSTGWICLHRCVEENPLWLDKPFAKGQAWIDLIMLANHTDHWDVYKGEKVLCKRGEVDRSILWLSDRWGWDRKKTKKFLSFLEWNKMATITTTTHRTTITIEKYDFYQQCGSTEWTTKDTTNEQQFPNHSPQNNKCNNETNKREIHKEKSDERFDELWKAYPKHVNKAKAKEKFDKMKVDDELFQKMLDSIERFKQTDNWKKDNGQFVPHLTTWLNQQRWEDEIPDTHQRTNSDDELFGGYEVYGL